MTWHRWVELSRSCLHTLFHTRLGRAPLAQLREYRLAEASHRLLATEDQVGKIAAATGYAEDYHLSHSFATCYGIKSRHIVTTRRY